jgi:thioesterase domain-containing protein
MRPHRLVLLPGLGADERLFQAQRAAIPELEVPAWPDPVPGESLREFAARAAEAVPAGEGLYLGGSSFGGMVALEMAARVRPKGCS